ncbi:hypothetical protein L7F22_008411 [Adiantum nelumboides]|nr:hypothetical protein [Adiantum nelumboides]
MSAVLALPQVKDFLKTFAKGKEKGQDQGKEHDVNAHAVTEEGEPSKKPWDEDIPELSSPSYSPPTPFSYSSDSSSSSNPRRRSNEPWKVLQSGLASVTPSYGVRGGHIWIPGMRFSFTDAPSFEALNQRAVAVVVDPIQSVKGKVVIDAFRLINPQTMMLGQEPRQTTSNLGHLNKPSIQALIHGLNRHYYSIAINYRKNELEEKMLLNLHKRKWTDGLTLERFDNHAKMNESTVQEMLDLAIKYNKAVQEEDQLPPEKLAIANVGRQDAKKHLEEHVSNLMSSNIVQTLGTMLDTVVF